MFAVTIAFFAFLLYLSIGGILPFCFGLASISMEYLGGVTMKGMLMQSINELASPVLLAIPLFLYAGNLMGESGIAKSLLDFANLGVRKFKGGLGVVSVVVCALLGAITGSSLTGIATVGPIMIPQMAEEGYPRGYSTALISISSILGVLIPPSIPLIIYGWISETSIIACFAATFIPGLIATLLFSILNLLWAKKFDLAIAVQQTKKEKKLLLKKHAIAAFPALLMPVIILYGIYGGIFSPSEAAAVAVAYAIPVGFIFYKGLNLKNLVSISLSSATTTASIMIVILSCMIFGNTMIMLQIPQQLTEIIIGLSDNKYVILLLVNLIFVMAGMFISDIVAILLTVPLLMPLLEVYQISPIHFGAVVGVSLAIGVVTPPYANALYLGIKIGETTLSDVIKPLLVFLLVGYLPVMILTTYIPELSLFLPRMLGLLS
jgi:C4-dicarboxylate transporter DctM subunit